MPDATAAVSDRPVARRSKPKRVLLITSQYTTPTTIAMKTKPYTSFGDPGKSVNPGMRLPSGISFVAVMLEPGSFTAALRSRKATSAVAMALSMIVEITSETPRVTRSRPAMPAQAAPTSIAARMAAAVLSQPGSHASPATTAAANDATRYWPSTPMLKRFIRKPMATATPER